MKRSNWSKKKKERVFLLILLIAIFVPMEITVICVGILLRNPDFLTVAFAFLVAFLVCYCFYNNMF